MARQVTLHAAGGQCVPPPWLPLFTLTLVLIGGGALAFESPSGSAVPFTTQPSKLRKASEQLVGLWKELVSRHWPLVGWVGESAEEGASA